MADEVNVLELSEFDIQHGQKLQGEALYKEKRSMIKGLVKCKTKLVLFIDIRSSKIKPDIVDSAINAVDSEVQINHQWRRRQLYPNLWEGAVAFFDDSKNARKTRRCLKNSKYLAIVPIHEVLDALIEGEIRYPDSSETATVLIFRAEEQLPREVEQKISAQLRRFGQVTDLKFQPHIDPGEICRAWYRYASHAIYAKLMCEQSTVPDVGTVSVEVVMNRKEARIMGYMRDYIRQK